VFRVIFQVEWRSDFEGNIERQTDPRIKNGKFVQVREETDLLGSMQQLGMELKPAEKKK
jgi:hypothetical protein